MKKVLIGLGIGCGVIVVAGIAMMIAGGLWVKHKVGGVMEAGKAMQAQNDEMKKLDARFPYDRPAPGEVLKLDASRLKDYFAIRGDVMPVWRDFEAKSEAFKKSHGDDDQGIGAATEAMGMLGKLATGIRAAFVKSATAHKMSPLEFHTITATIYSSALAKGAEQMNASMDQAKKEMQETVGKMKARIEDPATPESTRTILKQQVELMQKQSDGMAARAAERTANPASKEILAANSALLEPYKDVIAKDQSVAFDVFLGSDDMAQAFGGLGK